MLGLLRHAYAATTVDDFARVVTTELPRLIPSEITSYNEIDPVNGHSANWVAPATVATDEQNSAWEAHMAEHPVLRHYLATRDGRSLRISDFISERQFKATGLYREHYVPLQCDQVLAMFLDVPAPGAIGIGVHRSRCPFSDREQLILELLRPHLRQAHRNARAFSALRSRLDGLVAQLGDIVRIDRHGRIVFATGDAVEHVETYLGHEREPGHLPAELDAWRLEQLSKLPVLTHDASRCITPFVREAHGQRLVVRVIVEDEGCLLLVEQQRLGLDAKTLDWLGLTRREREILSLVAGGSSSAEVAESLGLSPRTVEKHLEHIYTKLRVTSRTEAVAVAFRHELP